MAFPPHVARSQRAAALVVPVLAVAAIVCSSAAAAYRDGFETPTPAWRLADSDCRARVLAHERTFQGAAVFSGAGAEYLRLQIEQGTSAHLTLAVPPARVIDELRPSLWVKASQAGVALRARVVLPRSRDPRNGSALAVWVEGEVYDRPGLWQRLTIRDVPLQVQRQARVKRSQPQSGEVDEREAYLDLIVLDAYTRPGVIDLWVDELDVEGFTEAGRDALAVDGDGGNDPGPDEPPHRESGPPGALAQSQPPHLEGTTLVAGQGPLAVRMIEHRGESLAWLKTLGFNTVRLARPATPQELEEARRLDLWLAAPPPATSGGVGQTGITTAHDRVAAWDLGRDLGTAELEAVRQLAREVRLADPRATRPLLAAPREQFWGYRRACDVLLLGGQPLGTRQNLADYRSYLIEQASQAPRPGPLWAAVQAAIGRETLAQLEAITGGPVAAPVEAAQVRLLALAALEAGATGLCFLSPAPLDAGDAVSQHRTAVLHALNEELALVEPWIAGAAPRETLDLGSDEMRGSAWGAERSKLILLTRHYVDDQFTAAPAPPQQVSLLLSGAPPSWKAYRIGPDRLTPVWSSQVGGGMRIQVPDVRRSAWIVVTDDPLTMNFVSRRLRQSLTARANLRHEILSRELAYAEQVLAGAPPDFPEREAGLRGLDETRQAMRQCERLMDAGDPAGSLEIAARVEQLLTQVRRRTWWSVANQFPSRVASPCCTSFGSLPLHWGLAERIRSAAWGPNLLAAGDFEDVRQMQSAGWAQQRSSAHEGATQVELASDRPQQGQYALHLGASNLTAPAAADRSPSPLIRIASAPVTLNAGSVVRIYGWIRGTATDQQTILRIRDSLGGEALADQPALSSEWRPFALYRAAPRATQLTLAFELIGPGDVWIDGVSIEVLQTPTSPLASQAVGYSRSE